MNVVIVVRTTKPTDSHRSLYNKWAAHTHTELGRMESFPFGAKEMREKSVFISYASSGMGRGTSGAVEFYTTLKPKRH